MPTASRGSSESSEPVGLSVERFTDLFVQACDTLWLIAVAVLGDRHAAEDAVQEAAMHALNKRDSFTPGTSFTAWMSQIVRFVALNHLRKRKRRDAMSLDQHPIELPARNDPAASQGATDLNDAAFDDQRLFDDRLARALSQLDPTARACLLLRVVGELDYDRIAKTMDIPPGTAMSHVYRSRQRLRDQLENPVKPTPTENRR